MRAVLIAPGGLPGTGKTSVARTLVTAIEAVCLRIDAVGQAIRRADALRSGVGAAGYGAAAALASENLALGRRVIADAVSPVEAARNGWRAAAREAGAALLEVELVCRDAAEHRRRVEGRAADIPGHTLPDWEAVRTRRYEPWRGADLVLDTAALTPPEAASAVARLAMAEAGR